MAITKEHPNIKILETAVHKLGPLVDEMVFLGGCATCLLLTDPAAPPPRVTYDVDVIVEAASLLDYHKLSEKLRRCNFSEDMSPDTFICRWRSAETILDVMPTHSDILGFGCQWYSAAYTAAISVSLPSGKLIRVLPAPYFLATKFDAFKERGKKDYLLSKDMEDIISILDGRPEIIDEILHSAEELRSYLSDTFSELLNKRHFTDALPGHLLPDKASQSRLPIILSRIDSISKIL
jgi:hypothetical protein